MRQGIADDGEECQKSINESPDAPSHPLQQIYYGAPGTGKSHIIKEQTQGSTYQRETASTASTAARTS